LIGERFFRLFDTDRDGYLNKAEFESCICRLFVPTFEEKIKLIFDLFDFDSDGKISKEGIRTLLSHIPPVKIIEVTNVAKPKEPQITNRVPGLYRIFTNKK
jgi:Ca2+-binding EF-hand superfamily protein